jgi:hypothetical protein
VTSANAPVFVCNGKKGADGVSAEANEFEGVLGPCLEGGVEVTSVSDPTYVCNGKEGKPGKEGSPWTLGGTLPPGATETGAWSFNADETASPVFVPISFPVQLAKVLTSAHVHYSTDPNFTDFDEAGEGTIGCKSGLSNYISPTAPAGELCVYRSSGVDGGKNAEFGGIFKVSSLMSNKGAIAPGAILKFTVTEGGPGRAMGTFAVTGCKEASEAEPNPPFKCP